ncbi:MORN repeat-containing protein 5 [Megalopta genalis]|uniref:MORN repeat-containing protein 5 n=1 Tax=Megalopta genalis TaxID=115081 RepID=UPI003FD37D28
MEVKLKHFDAGITRFIDGSQYEGTWNAIGMDGIGTYVYPHNAKYQGEFRDDTFHGHGTIYWPRGQRMDGVWSRGEWKRSRFIFADDLIFLKNGWKYCKFPDRRYHLCLKYGLRPAGATLSTNNEREFMIPPLCYDSGTGIFDPSTHCIVSYRDPKKVLQIPSMTMARWIMDNCRKAWTKPTGHRPHLYENWFPRKDTANDATDTTDEKVSPLSSLLPFSKCSSQFWWKRYQITKRLLILRYYGLTKSYN